MRKLSLLFLSLYKKVITPFLFALFGNGCRFTPTCSQYMKQAIERFGFVRGGVLGVRRILSCHPLSTRPHQDVIPKA